jgi:hypothetical protein
MRHNPIADLLVLDRNPLLDIHNTLAIKYVMKNGELFEADTLERIWPTAKKLDRQYWWDGAPTTRSFGNKAALKASRVAGDPLLT